ncbi:MAG: hypothetical protein IKQ44_02075 [Lachnospiraceae bacterium]|nr:hypothetical protein [Lachnospiraceae bacterium]
MKKFLALVLVGVMAFSTAVLAAPSPSAQAVSATVASNNGGGKTALQQAAEEAGMSEQEYSNNSVVTIDGIEDVAPMGIPTGIYLNGKKINYTIHIFKLSKAQIKAIKEFAGNRKIINTFGVKNRYDQDVQTSFYCPKIKETDKVSVYQNVNGKMEKLTSSVRKEHVDVVLKGKGYVVVLAE